MLFRRLFVFTSSSKEMGNNLLKKVMFAWQRCGAVTECVKNMCLYVLDSNGITCQSSVIQTAAFELMKSSVQLA